MIERQVQFDVHPEKKDEFVSFFVDEYRPAMSRSDGFLQVNLLVDPREPCHYQMAIRFESQAASDAWRASDAHKALSPRLKEMYTSSQIMIYEVAA